MGFERAGIETVLQAECDPACLRALKRRWPNAALVSDVRMVGERRLGLGLATADATGSGYQTSTHVDLVYGGFPCQDVSVAGKRAGLSGERSGLWSEFRRVLHELRPWWTVVENVPGLLTSNAGRDFATILFQLVELGYGVSWRVLDAQHFGVPQRRRRVFVVGCLGNESRAAQVLAVCESCGGNPEARRETRQDVASAIAASAGHHGHSSPRGDGSDNLVIARALTAGNKRIDAETESFIVEAGVRRLTPLECERLQGWPDDHTAGLADSTRYRIIGNGVAAPVAEWIGHRLMLVNSW